MQGQNGPIRKDLLWKDVHFRLFFVLLCSFRKPTCSVYRANVTGNPALLRGLLTDWSIKSLTADKPKPCINCVWNCITLFKPHCLKTWTSQTIHIDVKIWCFMNGSNVRAGILKPSEMLANVFRLCKLCTQSNH